MLDAHTSHSPHCTRYVALIAHRVFQAHISRTKLLFADCVKWRIFSVVVCDFEASGRRASCWDARALAHREHRRPNYCRPFFACRRRRRRARRSARRREHSPSMDFPTAAARRSHVCMRAVTSQSILNVAANKCYSAQAQDRQCSNLNY